MMFCSNPQRFVLLWCLFFSVSVQADEVRVAVAANFLPTIKVLAPVFEAQSGARVIISGASSGKLYAQIVNGAPYDVFLSADRHFPEKLIERRKASARSRYVYAKGALVLWSTKLVPVVKDSLDSGAFKYISIANPRTAPYGTAAKQVMQKLGVWDAVQPKLVRGESIGQSFQFVATGNAELGFVSLSQVINPLNRMNRDNYWRIPAEYYDPIEQEAVLLKKGESNPAASDFMGFLRSDESREIITQYGYFVD